MKPTLLLITASAVLLAACGNRSTAPMPAGDPAPAQETAAYTCPMHPHYISTDPDGACPICGMDLVPASVQAGRAAGDSGERGEILYYKHPMGLPKTSPVPKQDSMGMDYIPVYADEAGGSGVAVAPEMIQTMGIRTEPAAITPLTRTLRAFGTVEANERLETVSVARLEGWIEDLTVRAEGDTVRPGARLYRVYSPDLIAAQKDMLASLTIGNAVRIAAVRQRLLSLGMAERAVRQLMDTRQLTERVPVYAEAGGTVAALEVREGDYVEPGTPVLRLQSYAGVWVMAAIPESDLPLVDTGQHVRLTYPSAPDAPGKGTIDYIYPTIDAATRTGQVRIEVDNTAGYLRPGAYADITIDLRTGDRLTVPTESILMDSTGAQVIIARGEGRFAARRVQTGLSAGGRTEILSGLDAGDEVVTRGQFLLGSEASLREGLRKLQAPSAVNAGPDTPLSELPIDAGTLAGIDHFTDMALYFHEALTDGYPVRPGVVDPALGHGEVLRTRFAGTRLEGVIAEAEAALRDAKAAREGEALATALARLVAALEPWLMQGAPVHYRDAGLSLFRDTGSGRAWIQQGRDPRNPYGDTAAERTTWPDPMAELVQ